ncbi:MAG: M23 family metallopeptidase [Candidatus Micrarchaeota archaeon]
MENKTIAITAVLLFLVLALTLNKQAPSEVSLIELNGINYLSQEITTNEGVIKTKSALYQEGEYLVRETILENTGSNDITLEAFDVIPKEFAESVNELLFSSEPSISTASFLSLNPIIRKTQLTIPKESSLTITRKTKTTKQASETTPLLFLLKPSEINEELTNALKQPAFLSLSFVETSFFEAKASQELIEMQEKKQTQLAESLNEFTNSVKEKQLLTPVTKKTKDYSYNDVVLKEIEKEFPTPTPISVNLFPELPEKIEFTVSETNPQKIIDFEINSSIDLGSPLVKTTGAASNFLSLETLENKIEINAFVTGEYNNEGQWEFNEVQGEVIVAFPRILGKQKTIPVKIKIEHDSIYSLNYYLNSVNPDDPEPIMTENLIEGYNEFTQTNAIQLTTPNELELICPLENTCITSLFGWRTSPKKGASTNHQGIDLRGTIGTIVRAPADGIIMETRNAGSCGNKLVLSHDTVNGKKIETKYCHLNSFIAKNGQTVKKGEAIATVGNTGVSTGPHLHFEVRINNIAVNPTAYACKISAC